MKASIPADSRGASSGYHSAEFPPSGVTAAASTQSSGYGTNEVGERPGSREMAKKSTRTRSGGAGQAAQQDLPKPKLQNTPDKQCKLLLV